MRSNNIKIAALFDVVKNGINATLKKLNSRKIPSSYTLKRFLHSNNAKTLKQKYLKLKKSRSVVVQNNPQETTVLLEGMTKNRLLKSKLLLFISGLKPTKFPTENYLNNIAHFFTNIKGSNVKLAIITVVVLMLGGVFSYELSSVPAYAVFIDGKTISYVSDKSDVQNILSLIKKEKIAEWKRRVDITQTVTFKSTQAKRYQVEDAEELKKVFDQKLNFVAVATAIEADGEIIAVVNDAKVAEEILQELKSSSSDNEVKVEDVGFKEKIQMVNVPISLREVLSKDKALQLIKEGKEEKKVHIVEEGDSLWTIARKNDTHVEDLLKANPSLKGEHLDIGQELNLVAIEPLINVQTTGEITLEETVPYKVVVETNKNLWRGSQEVKTKGENGLKEVTYKVVMINSNIVSKEVLNEKVLKEATDKVVVKGSRVVVASRGGSGLLGWPIRGQITSRFGKRGREFHTGLDINGTTGQPIGAAEAGKVTATGWYGGYGRMVTINHGNGLVTKYAHLSRIKVSVGQHVERGDLIGLCGSTGRSTGSHLHFEVIIDGNFKNPLNYLK
ncbi:peptidoglycan DD-metalloendopeptidase family protein [Phosphitispora sp. TUW77]|uniref:peptidoglycan DD-metalloendopeptidase family protein n=1 Tax=Phosphitispora sp. TUW77 TaxID=3152361 RepID=UPI003AB327BC